ncbi:NF-X1-type zinc finger protein NFXL1 [Platanthera guangdongensis]|uniref:NF-X1-type zinc finger protein NFXL1 n=1 Tax=Platanthera guangdongensis TaxID=2320717 RepID=A0ABR2MF47_9ASPA
MSSSSSSNRQIPAAGHRPRTAAAVTAANNRQEWIPRASTVFPVPPSDRPHLRPSRRPHAPFASSPSANTASVPQLVYEIQEKLARGKVECMICYDMVGRSAPIWSCAACFSIFHLHCVRKWARSPTSAADPTPTSSGDWRCPGCQYPQSTPARDLSYTCFCGRRHDPPNDLYLTPHSCGEPCGKPLDHSPASLDNPSLDGEGRISVAPTSASSNAILVPARLARHLLLVGHVPAERQKLSGAAPISRRH